MKPAAPPPTRPNALLFAAVFGGGALGALLRVLALRMLCPPTGSLAPWQGLVVVNAFGSLALGLLMGSMTALSTRRERQLVCFFGVGCCGTLTTFSAVTRETVQALLNGPLETALGQLTLGLALCVLLAGLGFFVGRRVGAGFARRAKNIRPQANLRAEE